MSVLKAVLSIACPNPSSLLLAHCCRALVPSAVTGNVLHITTDAPGVPSGRESDTNNTTSLKHATAPKVVKNSARPLQRRT